MAQVVSEWPKWQTVELGGPELGGPEADLHFRLNSPFGGRDVHAHARVRLF